MPSAYAGAASWASTIDLPDDGDPPSAAIFDPPLEGLADRTQYLHRILPGLSNMTLQVPVIAGFDGGGGNFSFALLGSRLGALQYAVGTAGEWIMPLVVPVDHSATTKLYIEQVRANFFVDTGRGSLPTTFPILNLYRQIVSGASGYTTPLSSTIFTPGSVGAYEIGATETSFGTVGTSTTTQLTTDYQYWLGFTGETGGGAMANKLILLGAEVRLAVA